ncbi:tyrosine-type recombinase/integrase [Mesonia aestuariivivens]|uniref:Tyrosine-type recombinase/integrase n=1 Tax=Mesonia aestuariivivens TaxID=2796128 RepID=A0ABS6W7J3_9FLAO|nr:tyrosine-type recombinase/integrase [Mesonia aestuariivivens]MBW2963089.1 tyrosine-type recombinase/integrase [Mesonia aestuariivivens]
MITLHNYLKKKYSKSTLNSNLYNIKRFTDYYQAKAPKATYKDVLNYIEHLRKNYDLHPKTLRHCLYGVKIYFNYLLEIGKRKDHPCSELYLKDKISKQIEVDNLYSPETLEHFFESYTIKRKTYLFNRNKIIISLLIYQGLTVNEITGLEVENIDLEKGGIFIKGSSEATSKSPRSRTLPLQAKQILLILNYLEKDRKKLLKYNKEKLNEPAFILGQYGEKMNPHGISKTINENRKESERIQPIKIRQSVIANLLKKENDTRIVQVFAGHKRASTTVQYKQSELEVLQNAVDRYHPIS